MRSMICAGALLLSACGQGAAPPKAPEAPGGLPVASDLTGPVVVRGDPQWRLDIDRDMGMSLGIADGRTWAAPYVAPQRTALGYRFASGDLTVELEIAPCTTADGATYPMTALVWAQGYETINGCAAERWDTHLLDLMTPIDACIAMAPEARRVSYAGAREGGYVVRLWSENGGIDCAVGANGLAQIAPRDAGLRIGVENEALFVRGPGQNPGGECFEAPEVRSASGELLGWMDDPHGC